MGKTSSIWLWRNLFTERIILLFSKAGSHSKNLGGGKVFSLRFKNQTFVCCFFGVVFVWFGFGFVC